MSFQVEPFGTDPVPNQLRSAGFIDPFLIMINFFINPGTIITAAMGVAAGLSVFAVLVVQLLGVIVSMLAFFVMARIGVDYGLTGQMACRAALGVRGGRWLTSPLRAACSIYWFAFQTQAGALALAAVLYQQFQISVPLVELALFFALAQILVAALGYRYLQKLFRWAFPLKIIALAVLFNVLLGSSGASSETLFQLPQSEQRWLQVLVWFNAIFGGMLTMITDAADFTRYISNRRALWLGGLSGSFLGVALAAGFGGLLVAVTGFDLDQMFYSLLTMADSITVTVALLVLLVLDNWTINVINLYSGGISLCHTFERLGRSGCTWVVSILAVGLSCFPSIIAQYLVLAGHVGILFAGIAGVLLADYQGRQWRLNVPALYAEKVLLSGEANPYWHQRGFAVQTLLLIGMVTGLGFVLPEGWPVPLVVMALAALFYRLFCFNKNQAVATF